MAVWNRMTHVERRRICQALDYFLKVSLIAFPRLNVEFQRKRGIKDDSTIFILSNWKDGIALEIGENSVEQVREENQKFSFGKC